MVILTPLPNVLRMRKFVAVIRALAVPITTAVMGRQVRQTFITTFKKRVQKLPNGVVQKMLQC